MNLTPEQEAKALAALEAKEARTLAQVIPVKKGAIDRNSISESINDATGAGLSAEVDQTVVAPVVIPHSGLSAKILQFLLGN